MDERTTALSQAVEILRKNADENGAAAREHGKNGFYQCAADMKRIADTFEDAARVIEHMIHPDEIMKDDEKSGAKDD